MVPYPSQAGVADIVPCHLKRTSHTMGEPTRDFIAGTTTCTLEKCQCSGSSEELLRGALLDL